MLSEASMVLSRSVERFNPWMGYRFSTYACNAIARALLRVSRRETRYHDLFPVQHDTTLERPVERPDAEMQLRVDRLSRALNENLGALTELEQRVLNQRFPLGQSNKRTFRQIGASVGLSKERIRQIQNVALRKLRQVLTQDPVLH